MLKISFTGSSFVSQVVVECALSDFKLPPFWEKRDLKTPANLRRFRKKPHFVKRVFFVVCPYTPLCHLCGRQVRKEEKTKKTHFVKRGFFVVCPCGPLCHPCRRQGRKEKRKKKKKHFVKRGFFVVCPYGLLCHPCGRQGKNEKNTLCKTWFFGGLPIRSLMSPLCSWIDFPHPIFRVPFEEAGLKSSNAHLSEILMCNVKEHEVTVIRDRTMAHYHYIVLRTSHKESSHLAGLYQASCSSGLVNQAPQRGLGSTSKSMNGPMRSRYT